MGNKPSKQPVSVVKSNVASKDQFCECEYRKLSSEQELYAFRDHENIIYLVQDAMLRFIDARGPRRTKWQRMRRRFDYVFLDLVPSFCNPPCPKAIIYKLALLSLSRPSYTFVRIGPKRENDIDTEYRLRVLCGPSVYLRHYARRYQSYFAQVRCFYVNCEYAGRIACVYVSNIAVNCTITNLTLLYSHNNGADLGMCIGYVVRLARRFGANVISYDYAGFGISGGERSETGLYKSVESVYHFLTKTLRLPTWQIVAIGTSLGTAATIHLASRWPVRAVILQGAFLSALRVLCPFKCRISKHDQYENIEKVEKITAPTLIVHGRKDRMFCLRHAKLIHRHCPGAAGVKPFYLAKSGHLGFEDDKKYWTRLHDFLHREVVGLAPDGLCCAEKVALSILSRERQLIQAGLWGAVKRGAGDDLCDLSVENDQEDAIAEHDHSGSIKQLLAELAVLAEQKPTTPNLPDVNVNRDM